MQPSVDDIPVKTLTTQTEPRTTSGLGPEPVRVAVLLLTSMVVVGVITYLGPILKPFLIAVFLYFSMRVGAGVLTHRGIPASLAYLLLFAVGAAAMTILTLLAYSEIAALHEEWPRYQQKIQAILGKAPGDAGKPLAELFAESSREIFTYVFERGLGVLELLIMTFFYLLFIVLGASRLTHRVERAFPDGRSEQILGLARDIGAGMERFLQVKTQVSIGLGISAAVLMYLFGLRGWLLWGLLFFAFNYITYIGSIVACIPPIVLAFLDLGSPAAASVLAVLIVLNRFLWIDYVEIKLSGRHLNIDSILLFLWLAYWGWMWGVIGLILAFPMLTSLKIVMEHLECTRHWAVLMSEE